MPLSYPNPEYFAREQERLRMVAAAEARIDAADVRLARPREVARRGTRRWKALDLSNTAPNAAKRIRAAIGGVHRQIRPMGAVR